MSSLIQQQGQTWFIVSLRLWDQNDDKLSVIIGIIHFHEFPYTTTRTEICVYCFFETLYQKRRWLLLLYNTLPWVPIQQQGQKLVFISFFETLGSKLTTNCVLLLVWYTSMSSLIQPERQKLVFIVSLRLWNHNRWQTVCYC